MPSSSSTSSSEPPAATHAVRESAAPGGRSRLPAALLIAVVAIVFVEAALVLAADHYADTGSLMFELQKRRAAHGSPADVLLLGDSAMVAGVAPRRLETFLPPGVGVQNLALPGGGPAAAEGVLRRYLAHHEPPSLVVLGFVPTRLADNPDHFENVVIRHGLGWGDVLRVTAYTGRLEYPRIWLATRLPSLRHRKAIRSGLLSLAADRWTSFRRWLGNYLGFIDHPTDRYRFEWEYMDRVERNRRFRLEIAESGGWHHWREYAVRGDRLPDNAPRGAPRGERAVTGVPARPFRERSSR